MRCRTTINLNVYPGAVSFAVLSAIKFLREELRIMHRDVKPSNILLAEREGKVSIKLCDFGIAGNLINSLAKTNIGCKPYMSPERIETEKDQQGDDSLRSKHCYAS